MFVGTLGFYQREMLPGRSNYNSRLLGWQFIALESVVPMQTAGLGTPLPTNSAVGRSTVQQATQLVGVVALRISSAA